MASEIEIGIEIEKIIAKLASKSENIQQLVTSNQKQYASMTTFEVVRSAMMKSGFIPHTSAGRLVQMNLIGFDRTVVIYSRLNKAKAQR